MEDVIRYATKAMGYFILACMTLLLLLFLGGERFQPILSALGLYNPEQGIYADCSKPENRNNKFCSAPKSDPLRELRAVKEGAAFSLSDP